MELAELATKTTGLISNAAGYFRWADDPDGEIICRGFDTFTQKLCSEPDFYKIVESKVLEALKLNYPEDRVRVNAFIDEEGNPRQVEYVELEDVPEVVENTV